MNEVPQDTSDCSLAADPSRQGSVCSNENVSRALKALLKVSGSTPETVVRESMRKLNCPDEKCVLEHPRVKAEFGSALSRQALKPSGPKMSTAWLSDKNIFEVLSQWRDRYPDFHPVPCQMRDFEKQNTDLAQTDVPALMCQKKRVAVVMNTDVMAGPGIHWYVLFFDPTGTHPTLEYFNSTAGLLQPEIHRYLNELRKKIPGSEVVTVCRYALQKSDSECGVFSLWYIWSRLEGVPFDAFRVPESATDAMMYRFREYLFRKN